MKKTFRYQIAFYFTSVFIYGCSTSTIENPTTYTPRIPHLNKIGASQQLIVRDKPFLVLGGELGNSSFTSLEYMEPIWPKLTQLNLNTVLVPVFWELIEPQQSKFDFQLYDQLINEARKHKLKLIILWFGSWKNSMSSHVPSWVKTDQTNFPRVKDDQGVSQEILTPFSESNLNGDLKAFESLMQHIKEIDSLEHTVIMVQVENEIGMLPSARDYSTLANAKFHAPVPEDLIQYLLSNKEELVPEFKRIWGDNGFKTEGTWEDVFGTGLHTEELFMAWYFARYADKITEAGKKIYPLPMFVNAALNRPGRKPGEYPSAGPLPHLMDIWKAGGKAIDFLSPDFYTSEFEHWNDLYTRQNNPLFIPEHRFDNTVAAKALFAFGHYNAIGFSPFSIESRDKPEEEDLAIAYELLTQLDPIITSNLGMDRLEGVLLDKQKQSSTFSLGDYQFTVRHSHTLGWEEAAQNDTWEPGGAIFIRTSENEFYIAGSGIVATFGYVPEPALKVGILKNEEGKFEDDDWVIIRHLNGDQIHQGRHIRMFEGAYAIQRLELYQYE